MRVAAAGRSWCAGLAAAVLITAAPLADAAPPPQRGGPPKPGADQPPGPSGPPGRSAPPGRSGPPGSGRPPAEDQEPQAPPPEPLDPAEDPELIPFSNDPLAPAGPSPYIEVPGLPARLTQPTVALPDRWRIGWPEWDRYGRAAPHDPVLMNTTGGDIPFTRGNILNPYDRNVLKGDYPVLGDDIFVNITGVADTLINHRNLPTPSGVSAGDPGRFDFFGGDRQLFISQTLFASVDIFKGYTAFRPVDWLIRVSPAANFNYLELQERNVARIDVREDDSREDSHATLQETFFEYHLGDMSPMFDFSAVKVGRQLFVSDFRGFILNDIVDGVRLLGNAESNRIQYNFGFFFQNEKDTNSELAELAWRDQQILVANTYIQDFIWMGYTTQFSFHWNHDQSDREYNNNDFQVIPDLAGSARLHDIDAYYLGWTGDGHIGRVNISHAFYYAFGEDELNPIAGRPVDISGYMGALELSYDMDWLRPRVSFLYTSGDKDPLDGKAGGFDGILDNPFFAGGSSSFFQSQAFAIFGVNLNSNRSLYNDLAAPKAEGQANFVNPGVMLFNAGLDAELTPRLRASLNVNSVWFTDTSSLELFLNQPGVDRHLGDEINLTAQFRPFLNNNVILTAGGSVFFAGSGFEDVYGDDDELYQAFLGVTLQY